MRLLATVDINGVPFHAEAFRCHEDENGVQEFDKHAWTKDAEEAAYLLNDQALLTLTVRSKPYVLLLYPHGS